MLQIIVHDRDTSQSPSVICYIFDLLSIFDALAAFWRIIYMTLSIASKTGSIIEYVQNTEVFLPYAQLTYIEA